MRAIITLALTAAWMTCYYGSTEAISLVQNANFGGHQYDLGSFRPKPLPRCRSFWITEFGYFGRLYQKPKDQRYDVSWYFHAEAGHLFNISQKAAIGAVLFDRLDDNGTRGGGAKARARYWVPATGEMKGRVSFDISAGLLLWYNEKVYDFEAPGLAASVDCNISDWLLFSLQYELVKLRLKFPPPGQNLELTNSELYFGVKGGSYLGLTIGATVIILITIFQATYQGPF